MLQLRAQEEIHHHFQLCVSHTGFSDAHVSKTPRQALPVETVSAKRALDDEFSAASELHTERTGAVRGCISAV